MTRRRLFDWVTAIVWLTLAFTSIAPVAADPPSCRTVRLADVGWADVTATTGRAGRIVGGLGYDPKITVLSVPVTFNGMRSRDVDVFLGNWMPMQTADRKPFLPGHSIEIVRLHS